MLETGEDLYAKLGIPYGEPTMVMKLACRDLGLPTCPFVASGEAMEQVMVAAAKHAKEVHSYTDEQLNSPEMMAKVKAAVKQE